MTTRVLHEEILCGQPCAKGVSLNFALQGTESAGGGGRIKTHPFNTSSTLYTFISQSLFQACLCTNED